MNGVTRLPRALAHTVLFAASEFPQGLGNAGALTVYITGTTLSHAIVKRMKLFNA